MRTYTVELTGNHPESSSSFIHQSSLMGDLTRLLLLRCRLLLSLTVSRREWAEKMFQCHQRIENIKKATGRNLIYSAAQRCIDWLSGLGRMRAFISLSFCFSLGRVLCRAFTPWGPYNKRVWPGADGDEPSRTVGAEKPFSLSIYDKDGADLILFYIYTTFLLLHFQPILVYTD